jgi:hypothetical protein
MLPLLVALLAVANRQRRGPLESSQPSSVQLPAAAGPELKPLAAPAHELASGGVNESVGAASGAAAEGGTADDEDLGGGEIASIVIVCVIAIAIIIAVCVAMLLRSGQEEGKASGVDEPADPETTGRAGSSANAANQSSIAGFGSSDEPSG